MVDLNPPRAGGRIRLTPTGDGGYRSERLPLEDPLEGASDEEREFFRANFQGRPLAELLRRLCAAESNAKYLQESLHRAQETIQELRRDAAPEVTPPPPGWELPKPAADLLDCADRNGWLSATRWGVRSDGEPMVSIQLAHGRELGKAWRFEHLTWAASGAGRSMKRLGRGLQSTPEHPSWHDAPSLTAIRAVIEANPATNTTTDQAA